VGASRRSVERVLG